MSFAAHRFCQPQELRHSSIQPTILEANGRRHHFYQLAMSTASCPSPSLGASMIITREIEWVRWIRRRDRESGCRYISVKLFVINVHAWVRKHWPDLCGRSSPGDEKIISNCSNFGLHCHFCSCILLNSISWEDDNAVSFRVWFCNDLMVNRWARSTTVFTSLWKAIG